MAVPDRGRLGKLLPLKMRMTGTGTATALYPDTRMRRQRRRGGVDEAATPAVDFDGGGTRLGIRSLRSLEGSRRLGNQIFFFFMGPSLCTFHIVSRVDHYYPPTLGPTLLPMPGVYIAHALTLTSINCQILKYSHQQHYYLQSASENHAGLPVQY
jgi:hypothetical protein